MSLLTEDEAKTKWCPLALAPGAMFAPDADSGQDKRIGVTQNRGYQMGGALTNCMCIASKCMAWRVGYVAPHEFNCAATRTQTDEKPLPCDCHPKSDRGYCGAFGKVEP